MAHALRFFSAIMNITLLDVSHLIYYHEHHTTRCIGPDTPSRVLHYPLYLICYTSKNNNPLYAKLNKILSKSLFINVLHSK